MVRINKNGKKWNEEDMEDVERLEVEGVIMKKEENEERIEEDERMIELKMIDMVENERGIENES